MKKFEHIKLSTLDFSPKKMGDLVYTEGPILSHFVGNDGKHYFFYWVDNDEKNNRWLVFELKSIELYKFFTNSINLKTIVSNKDFAYLIDLDSKLNLHELFLVDINNLPQDYMPATKTYFDEENYEDYAHELKSEILHEFRFNKLLKKYLAVSFSKSKLLAPLIESISLPSSLMFGQKKISNTILVIHLLDSALNFELTKDEKFEKIGFSIINNSIVNYKSTRLTLADSRLEDFKTELYQFLVLQSHDLLSRKRGYLYYTYLLKKYYKSHSRTKEELWIENLEQKIESELV